MNFITLDELRINKQIERNTLVQGDCLEAMSYIPDGSINMILADLPYGTTACKWDSVIDIDKLWMQYQRIVKQNGAIVLTAAQPFTSTLITSNMDLFKYVWVWIKNFKTGHLNAKKQPLRSVEDIAVFYKKQPTYNPQGIKIHGKIKNRGVGAKTNRKCGTINIQTHTGYPNQQLFFDRDLPSIHPTQKPVALFEYLIKTYTNEGDLILDNVAGSGTTAIACINTNRNYILMEMDEKYYGVAKERIEQHKYKIST